MFKFIEKLMHKNEKKNTVKYANYNEELRKLNDEIMKKNEIMLKASARIKA